MAVVMPTVQVSHGKHFSGGLLSDHVSWFPMQMAGTLHSLNLTSQNFLNYKLQSRDNLCNCYITPGDTINTVGLIKAGQ